MVKRICISVEL